MVPNPGDFHVLEADLQALMLARHRAARLGYPASDGIHLLSNVCRHRQALLKTGRGHCGKSIVCPIHRWSYALDGRQLGAPRFAQLPDLGLPSTPFLDWRGFIMAPTDADGRGLVRLPEGDFAAHPFLAHGPDIPDLNVLTYCESRPLCSESAAFHLAMRALGSNTPAPAFLAQLLGSISHAFFLGDSLLALGPLGALAIGSDTIDLYRPSN